MTNKNLINVAAILCGIIVLCFSIGIRAEEPEPDQRVDVALQQMIPLADGIHLAATVWRPYGQAKPMPVVLMFTPYVADETYNRALKFVRGGYVYVAVDVRGRGDSEGKFRTMRDAGKDGAQVVEWLAKQPWSNGQVAMVGGSYRGMVQWQVLAQHPKHLAAIIPTSAPYPGYDVPFWKGIMPVGVAQWLSYVSGRTSHPNMLHDFGHWMNVYNDLYKSGAPMTTLVPMVGTNGWVLQEWLKHHDEDAYWAAYNVDPRVYADVHVPILNITGYWDGDEPGELRYYRELLAHASKAQQAQTYLLIGPWDHEGTRDPQQKLGGLSFPDNAVMDMDQLQISWLDWVLKGGKRPAAIGDRVNYYEMGEGAWQWHHAASLDAVTDHTLKLYLSSVDGPATDVFHSGRLIHTVPADTTVDTLRSDPTSQAGLSGNEDDDASDQSDAFGGNSLIYQSAPLPHAVTLAGFMRFTSHISLDAPDADINAAVYAVSPHGQITPLEYDYVRARYRRGMARGIPVTPGAIEPYVFDGFYFIDCRIPAGSRIRLVLTPLSTPYLERNNNSGGPLGVEPMSKGRVATISVHLDAAHPSYLELPLAKE